MTVNPDGSPSTPTGTSASANYVVYTYGADNTATMSGSETASSNGS